ncbi:MAG: quinolinate synthase NadA [Planctomycetota bacterium]|nr:quinolinate synthase NadA [Planctomycetota bacterium]
MAENSGLLDEIKELKRKRNALIVAHNYQPPVVQDIADFCGDSLELARLSAKTDADVILFCGVDFMVEMAAILVDGKTVLNPEPSATCPMANMVTVDDVKEMQKENPNARVVCYVNSTVDVKSVSHICCTSGNAIKIFSAIKEPIIFVPDKFLGTYAASVTKRKDVILANGFCPTHMLIKTKDIEVARKKHPHAFVMVHPECTPDVTSAADAVLSTGGMVRAAKERAEKEFIVGTETGLLHRLQKENPRKRFYALNKNAVCPNMKKITLEKIHNALLNNCHKVSIPADMAKPAREALERMLSY